MGLSLALREGCLLGCCSITMIRPPSMLTYSYAIDVPMTTIMSVFDMSSTNYIFFIYNDTGVDKALFGLTYSILLPRFQILLICNI